ncbi:hypothetical protein NL676_000837 [Syzygium grande]|nr:hypothetical protein NL676_000837 [Syzygium grande]
MEVQNVGYAFPDTWQLCDRASTQLAINSVVAATTTTSWWRIGSGCIRRDAPGLKIELHMKKKDMPMLKLSWSCVGVALLLRDVLWWSLFGAFYNGKKLGSQEKGVRRVFQLTKLVLSNLPPIEGVEITFGVIGAGRTEGNLGSLSRKWGNIGGRTG